MWTVTNTRVPAESGEVFETYGIRINGTVINDISTDRQEIEELVRRLNELGASEIHAYELVEDFLGR